MRKRVIQVAILGAVCYLCLATAMGQGADACSAAQEISGCGTFAFDNSAAETDGEPADACLYFSEAQVESDVWFCWHLDEPASIDLLTASTCGQTGVDTKIAIYSDPTATSCAELTASTCGSFSPVACNDDACADLQSEVSVGGGDVLNPGYYLVRVGTYPLATGGGTGTFSMDIFDSSGASLCDGEGIPEGACLFPDPCADVDCVEIPDSSCQVLAEAECAAAGGQYQGDGTNCGVRDHYQCYEAKTAPDTPVFAPRTVNLADQFGSSDALIDKVKNLCNPVDKNGEGIIDETAHLTCYNIKESEPDFELQTVVVNDQFGELTLDVHKPERLCVPSEKNGQDSALLIDHYQCYTVKVTPDTPAFVKREVTLEDQFQAGEAIVEKPLALCNPVDKNGEGILDEENHLMCYSLNKQPKLDPAKFQVTSEDQFGQLELTMIQAQRLCVPATKESLCQTDADCDDGDPCTVDSCNAGGACSRTLAAPGTSCDDGLFCNGTGETCHETGECYADVVSLCRPFCDEDRDECVECLEDSHCTEPGIGTQCVDGTCVTPCT